MSKVSRSSPRCRRTPVTVEHKLVVDSNKFQSPLNTSRSSSLLSTFQEMVIVP
ncbi:hypothetical protein U1Q18_010638, partial [Sarracenia purpurea var. burkii]